MPATARAEAGAATGTVGECDGRVCLRSADGDFTLAPRLRLDADAGTFFGQDRPGGFRSGTNLRRARVGATGTLFGGLGYTALWDFGAADPNDASFPFEAQLNWSPREQLTLRAGAFKLLHLPEFAASSFDLLFLERSTIANLAASVASGTSRIGAGAEWHDARWALSGYATAGTISASGDGRARGLVGRAAWLLLTDEAASLQIGLNGARQFEPGASPGPNRISFGDYPELRLDTRRFLETEELVGGAGWAWGPEVAGRLGRFYFEGLYQRLGAELPGRDAVFSGWYLQGAYALLGSPRSRDAESAAWGRPRPEGGFDPAAGQFGALELAGRFSRAELRDGDARGGRQDIWTVAANWYPTASARLAAQYQNGRVTPGGDEPERPFQAVGLRLSLNY